MSDENIHQDTSKAASELNKLKSLRPELGPFAFDNEEGDALHHSPKKTESKQEDKCQNKPMEIIYLTDDEAEVQEKCFIDLTTDEEAEVKEKPFIDLTTAECHLELKELNKRLEEKEAEIRGSDEEIRGSDEEKFQLEKEKRALQVPYQSQTCVNLKEVEFVCLQFVDTPNLTGLDRA
ncbi:hypothetical protein F2Q68_00028963 [Brassica cretica]|uniref:Uncharacterized protein n=1 Tax=Brassica cretica TaxID=69181 RepID=A0A8S9G4X0_BRACR|nr:hypothetical protein F2Q68_00028963 [Brassica cretica]